MSGRQPPFRTHRLLSHLRSRQVRRTQFRWLNVLKQSASARPLMLASLFLYTVREFSQNRERANTGSANDLARLLARLQKGELLQPAQQTLLLSFMHRTMTGPNRVRRNLPAGTAVADK